MKGVDPVSSDGRPAGQQGAQPVEWTAGRGSGDTLP